MAAGGEVLEHLGCPTVLNKHVANYEFNDYAALACIC